MIENLEEALKGIFSHKMRSFLTMLGVIIGIAAILAIVSIVEGTSRKLQKNLIGAGNNVTIVSLQQNSEDEGASYGDEQLPTKAPLDKGIVKQIKAIDGVNGVSLFSKISEYMQVTYHGEGSSFENQIFGVDEKYFSTMQFKLKEGRNFTKQEYKEPAKVCIISKSVSEALFEGTDPVGKILDIKGEPFTIVGVVQSANSSEQKEYENENEYYMDQNVYNDFCVYTPASSFPILAGFDTPENVAISVADTEQMKAIGTQASDILNHTPLPQNYTYKAGITDESENSLKTLTTAITAMLVSIASLSLLVGGIGVMNIMLVSVTERTSEIGLKKALGAKRHDILVQFLTESAVLTGVGGLIGILLGILLAKIISVVVSLEFAVSIPWILIALGFSLLIGIFFGVMPANKAAKLNPIDALRRE